MPHTTTNNILDITDSPIRNVPERQQLEKWSQQWQDIKQFMVLKSQTERAKEINDANASEKNSDSENQAYVQTGEPVLENQGLFHQEENAHYEQNTAKADVEKLETRIAATSRAIENKLAALRDELNNALCNVGLVAPWSDERSKSRMYQTGDNVLIPLTLRMLDNLVLMKESNYFDFGARHYYGCVSPLSLGLQQASDAEISGVMDDLVNQVSNSQRISADDLNNPAHQSPLDEYIQALTKRLLKVREKLVSELEINESETEKATAKSNIKEAIREQVGEGVRRSRNKSIHDIDNEITKKLSDFVHQVISANFFIQSPIAARLGLLTIEQSVRECIASYHREKRAQHYLDDYYALVFRRADSMTDEELRELFFRHNGISENARYLLLSAASVSMIQKVYSKRHLLDGYANHVWFSPCVKYQGDTVMIPACAIGDDKVVKKLIDARIDVNAKDISDQTALMHAAENLHESVIEKLIEAGADVNAKDDYGDTALMYAAKNQDESVIKKLIEAGADVNDRNKRGRTVLMMAIDSGEMRMISFDSAREISMFNFIPVGENMPVGTEIVNKRGEEALKAARDHYGLICMENQERIFEYLLKNGADIFATNEYGETAFDIANARGNTKIARMLENAQIAATDMQPRFEPSP